MEIYEMLELNECPKCGGAGYLEDEGTSGVYISCIDCDAHTVVFDYKDEDSKLAAAKKAEHVWNSGKAISSHPGE